MQTRAFQRTVLASLALAAVIASGLSGCARRTFDVKVIEPVPSDAIGAPVSVGPVVVRFSPIWDEDWQLENLDANAAMAGVLPVRSEIENPTGGSVSVRKLRIVATDGHGRSWRLIDSNKARKRIEKFYGVRLRNKQGDKEYRADFESNALDVRSPLPAGARRQGLLYFEMPKDVRRAVPVTITATP